jgi:hypothetical protein
VKNKKEKIYECEVKRLFMKNGQRVWKWKRVLASEVIRHEKIRCYCCRGQVRLHKKKIPTGPSDHVEHFRRIDSEGCPLGCYFLGVKLHSTLMID